MEDVAPTASGSHEARAPKVLREPLQPSQQERIMHNFIHVPFRAWCRESVLGRGRDCRHRSIAGSDDAARPVMDYMLLSEYGLHRGD